MNDLHGRIALRCPATDSGEALAITARIVLG
jgi:hypothetical protein